MNMFKNLPVSLYLYRVHLDVSGRNIKQTTQINEI